MNNLVGTILRSLGKCLGGVKEEVRESLGHHPICGKDLFFLSSVVVEGEEKGCHKIFCVWYIVENVKE